MFTEIAEIERRFQNLVAADVNPRQGLEFAPTHVGGYGVLSQRNEEQGFTLMELLVVIALLLVIRQWYVGGRIPFLREPEKFRVDPLPPGQVESQR